MPRIENKTFDEIRLGDTASLVRTLTHEDIEVFAIMSGDVNPAHVDETFAKSDMFHKVVAHGMWGSLPRVSASTPRTSGGVFASKLAGSGLKSTKGATPRAVQ